MLPAAAEAPGPRRAGRLRLLPIWGHCLSLPEGHPPPASHCPLAVSCWPKPWPASSLFISLLVAAPGRTQWAGKGAGIGLALLQPWSPWPAHPGLFPAQCLSLTCTHAVHVEGAPCWAGPLAAPVTLLALAQAPEEKWGGEGHSCLPSPLQNSPSLCESGPDANEAGVPRSHSGLRAATLGTNLGSGVVGGHLPLWQCSDPAGGAHWG